MVMRRRLIDEYRAATAARNRDAAQAKPEAAKESGANNNEAGLAALAERMLEVAEGRLPRYVMRKGPQPYPQTALLALILLRAHLKLSTRGLTLVLAMRPDVLWVLGLRTIPDRSTVIRAERAIRQSTKRIKESKR